MVAEGVIQFAARHVDASLDDEFAGVGAELIGWRNVLFAVGFIGLDPQRYDGVGFGKPRLIGGEMLAQRLGHPVHRHGTAKVRGAKQHERVGCGHCSRVGVTG